MTSTPTNDNGVFKVKRLNQYFGALIASVGGFSLGVLLGWNSSAGETLRNNLDATRTEIALVGSVLNVGACLGILVVPLILKYTTRPSSMFLTIPVFAVGWLFICFAGQKVALYIIGRLICGICGGMFCILTPSYVAEIADKKSRGRLLTFFQLLINCGIMYAFLVAHMLDKQETVWRYSLICGITCLTIAPVNFLPESPLYYLSRGDEMNAEMSLRWYRGNTYKLEDEMVEMKQLLLISHPRKISLKIVLNLRVIRSFVICFVVILTQQLCGANAMIFYALTLFNIAGSGDLSGSEQTLVVGAVQILSSLLATVLVDLLGRRILLTISSTLMGLFLILLGWFFRIRDMDPEYDDIYFWMPTAWISLFFGAFNIGVAPISWSLLGDIFPTEIKITAAVSAACFGWLISLITMLTFGEMIVALGAAKLMWLFASFCWLAAIFSAVVVRDTSGKSLTEIQQDFGIESPTRRVEDTR